MEQRPVPETRKTRSPILWIVCSVLAFYVVCGAGYYGYVEYVIPSLETTRMKGIAEDLLEVAQVTDGDAVTDTADYAKAFDMLQQREERLSAIQNRVSGNPYPMVILPSSITPRAKKAETAYKDISSLLAMVIAANTDTRGKTVFLADAYDLLVALGRYSPRVQKVKEAENMLDPRQPRTAQTVLREWESRVSDGKRLGKNLFSQRVPDFGQADSGILLAAWEKAYSGFDDLLAYLRSLDPATPFSYQIVPVPQTELEIQRFKGAENVLRFVTLVDSIISANSARSMVTYRDEEIREFTDALSR